MTTILAVLGWLVALVLLIFGLGEGGFLAAAAGLTACNLDYPVTCEDGDLAGEDLTGVDFTYARLRGTDLTGANLSGANFNFADLTGTKLVEADLTGADFRGAALANADLTDADLTGAIFTSDNALRVLQLEGVRWSNTICPDGTNSDDHHMTCINNIVEEPGEPQ
jgi:uncharacterized protein YjbI with pentapeptide repeats